MTTGMGSRPRKHPHAAARVYEGEAFIVLPHEHKIKILNDSGSRIWELIDGARTIGEIAKTIEDEFDVTYDQALADVREFVGVLEENSMLATGDDPGGGKVA